MPGPKRRKPTKEEIAAIADRAEGKKPRKRTAKPKDMDAPIAPADEEELMPGGVRMVIRRPGGGRPPKYRPEYARVAAAMVRRGATIAEIANAFGVANSTIYLWQQTYDEFMEGFSEISGSYDQRIERTLAERALGYTYDAVKIFNNKDVGTTIVPYREHVPPDITAIKLWLSQRKPEQWKVKDEIEVSTNEAFVEIWKRLGEKKE